MTSPLSLCLLAASGLAMAKDAASFRRPLADAEVDWTAGTLTAEGGAAADLRMPDPNAARPGAERRARAAAEAKLQAAIRELAPSAKARTEGALAKARIARIEYQSNGGVVLWLAVDFADFISAKPAAVSLRATSLPFELAPVVTTAGKTAVLGFATYRPAKESPNHAVPVQRDRKGRLVLPDGQANLLDSLAGAAVVIYLEKPQP